MRKRIIPALLIFASLGFSQEPEHLKVAQLPTGLIGAKSQMKAQTVEAKLLELAEIGNKNGEYTYIYNQIVPMLSGKHLPITDDELLDVRKAMSVQICNFGIFDYYFCNSKFVQEGNTAAFKKTQGSQLAGGNIYRIDESTLYLLEAANDGSNRFTTTTSPKAEMFEASPIYKLSDGLYVILHSSNGTCGEIHVLR